MALQPGIAMGVRRRQQPNYLAEMAAVEQIKANRAQGQRANAIREAMQAANGDPAAMEAALLQAGDVRGAMALREEARDAQSHEMKMISEKLEIGKSIIGGVHDEVSYQRARGKAVQLGLGADDWPANFDPEWVGREQQSMLDFETRLKMQQRDRHHADRMALGEKRINNSGMRFSVGPDGAVTFAQGAGAQGGPAVPLNSAVGRESQQAAITASENLDNLDRIASQFNPDFLTYQGKGRAMLAEVMDKAGTARPEQRDLLKAKQAFSQGVSKFFNAYRKEITGAAATEKELEQLKDAVINMDQSPAQFQASLAEMRASIAHTLRIKNRLLREGLRVGSKRFGARMDKLYREGADDDAMTRGEELEQAGKSDDEVVRILVTEGYL